MSERHSVYGGAIVDIAEDDLRRISKILSGIPGGAKKAVGSALSRAASSGKTNVKGYVTSEYTISQKTYLKQTRNINHFTRDTSGGFEVVFGFAGNVIPLTQFDTTVTKDGVVSTRVKTSSAKEKLDEAFLALMGTHNGIYERIGMDRFPVKELFGPATPQMMYSNEDVMDKMEERMTEVYNVRVEHEIDRLLNGWGG